MFFFGQLFFSKREFLASVTWSNFARSLGKGMFDCSSWQSFWDTVHSFCHRPTKTCMWGTFLVTQMGLKGFSPWWTHMLPPTLSIIGHLGPFFFDKILQSREENQSSPKWKPLKPHLQDPKSTLHTHFGTMRYSRNIRL